MLKEQEGGTEQDSGSAGEPRKVRVVMGANGARGVAKRRTLGAQGDPEWGWVVMGVHGARGVAQSRI